MNTTTSTKFISTAATGENWRDISKKVLEQLEALKTDGFKPNVGFLYVTGQLAEDAGSILSLFQSVTMIDHWTGCVAFGVCGNGEEFVDVPAISVMIGSFPPDHFRAFTTTSGSSFKKLHQEMEPWLNKHDPMLITLHADPLGDGHMAAALEEIDSMVGGFMVGGLASSQDHRIVFSHDAKDSRLGGFVFSADVPVATCVSQGCIPMGPWHEISAADEHVIAYLDGRTPVDVFTEDMKAMAEKKLGYKAENILEQGAAIPDDLMTVMKGEAHVAFPVAGTDQKDVLVRNIMAIDPETGMIAVAENIHDGQKMMFVHRDDETVRSDLAASLVALRKRVTHEKGSFAPKAALYISCVARTRVSFAGDGAAGGEMALLREILGDIPMTGFYAAGEISGSRIYGYTGILALFL